MMLALVTLTGRAAAYETMAGSCEGVFSGAHVRIGESGKKRGDGGWKMQVLLPLPAHTCAVTPSRLSEPRAATLLRAAFFCQAGWLIHSSRAHIFANRWC